MIMIRQPQDVSTSSHDCRPRWMVRNWEQLRGQSDGNVKAGLGIVPGMKEEVGLERIAGSSCLDRSEVLM